MFRTLILCLIFTPSFCMVKQSTPPPPKCSFKQSDLLGNWVLAHTVANGVFNNETALVTIDVLAPIKIHKYAFLQGFKDTPVLKMNIQDAVYNHTSLLVTNPLDICARMKAWVLHSRRFNDVGWLPVPPPKSEWFKLSWKLDIIAGYLLISYDDDTAASIAFKPDQKKMHEILKSLSV